MALSDVWTLLANARGQADDVRELVWVDPAVRSGIVAVPRPREVVAFYAKVAGGNVPHNVTIVDERSTRVLRMRWRDDLTARSVMIDPDGRNWYVNAFEAVGRRQWADVSLTTYDTLTAPDDDAMFTPPAGWPFRDAAGDPVQILTGWTGRFSEHGAILGFRHTIPVGGWTIVGNFDSSAPWLAELPNGRDIELTLSTSEDVVRANLTEGSEWIWTMRFPGAHSRFPGHALTPTGVMAIRCKQFHLPDL